MDSPPVLSSRPARPSVSVRGWLSTLSGTAISRSPADAEAPATSPLTAADDPSAEDPSDDDPSADAHAPLVSDACWVPPTLLPLVWRPSLLPALIRSQSERSTVLLFSVM